jgi:hypothetical protein
MPTVGNAVRAFDGGDAIERRTDAIEINVER